MSDVESPNLVLTFNTLNMMKMLEYLIKSYFCRIVMSGVHCHVHLYLLSILTFQLNKNHFYSEIDKLGPVIQSHSYHVYVSFKATDVIKIKIKKMKLKLNELF